MRALTMDGAHSMARLAGATPILAVPIGYAILGQPRQYWYAHGNAALMH